MAGEVRRRTVQAGWFHSSSDEAPARAEMHWCEHHRLRRFFGGSGLAERRNSS